MTLRSLYGQDDPEVSPQAVSAAVAERDERPVYHARAELVLAAAVTSPLRAVPLRPDPLQSFAAAVYDVRPELGERAEVCLDLLPLTPARVAHLRRRYSRPRGGTGIRAAQLAGGVVLGAADVVLELLDEFLPGRGSASASRSYERMPDGRGRGAVTAESLQDGAGKLGEVLEPVFAVQLLLRTQSEIPGRAQAHLHQLLAAFDVWRAENWWKVRGLNLGVTHIGADSVLFRHRFDRRLSTGEFAPRRRTLLTTGELAGLLKPPTKHCAHHNVARSGGMVPPPPRQLPVYAGQSDVIPLGYAPGPDGRERLLGMPIADLFFSLRIGKTRYGKTETALAQAVSLALGGHGVWFLDPHADGWRRARPLLTHPKVLARLWEIDLTVRGGEHKIAGYNPLSMTGQTREHIEDRVDAVVTAIASALSWGDAAPRAKTILTKACETLCHLALHLPAEAAPTLFQIRTLLDDDVWRQQILGVLPRSLQRYWTITYPKYPVDATPTITNVIERLAASQTLSAFFGSSMSTYDVRAAMDTGQVVFLCPPGGDIGRLVSCFLIYDLFRAGRSRIDLPATQRHRFDAFVDEVTAVDGAAKGHLASILEQLGKYEVRLHAMTQMAGRLTPATRDALLQNQSLLSSTAGEIDAVRPIAKQWARYVEPHTLVDLPRFHHVLSATVDGQGTTPFKVRGPVVTDLFADHHRPDRLTLQAAAINTNLARRPIADILTDLESLDDRILACLATTPTQQVTDAARPRSRRPRSRSDGHPTELPEAALTQASTDSAQPSSASHDTSTESEPQHQPRGAETTRSRSWKHDIR